MDSRAWKPWILAMIRAGRNTSCAINLSEALFACRGSRKQKKLDCKLKLLSAAEKENKVFT